MADETPPDETHGDTQTDPELERVRVEKWRYKTLVKAGYPPRLARQLSRDPDVDLHKAIELLENGCPVELAEKILL